MTRPRDSRQGHYYRAEGAAYTAASTRVDAAEWYGCDLKDAAAAQQYADRVTRSRWWRSRWGWCSRVKVKVRRGMTASHAHPGSREITLATRQMNAWVLLHEMAHIVADRREAWHGRAFARTHLALVKRFIGKESATLLRRAFVDEKVRYRRAHTQRRPADEGT